MNRSFFVFSAFIKPEKVANTVVSQEEYSVSRYYEEVNRTKYTNERKKQLSFLLGSSSAGTDGSNSTGGTKSTTVSGSTRDSDIVIARKDSGIFVNNSEEESDPVQPMLPGATRDNDIHTSIFTDPLAACRRKYNDTKGTSKYVPKTNLPTESAKSDDVKLASAQIKGSTTVSAHIKDDKGTVNSVSKTSENTLENKGNSPRTKLKGRIQEVCSATRAGKACNGYIRNPETKLNTVLITREGDLDVIDECSVLVHNSPGENIKHGTEASSCNSKLLSSSLESNNGSSV